MFRVLLCSLVLASCTPSSDSSGGVDYTWPAERGDSPEKYADYIWRDDLCDGESGSYSGYLVNTISPREAQTYELVATLNDGGRRVARDSELVIDAPPGVAVFVEFVFGATGDACALESVSFR